MTRFACACIVGAIGVGLLTGASSGAGILGGAQTRPHARALLHPQSTTPFATFSTSKNGGTAVVVSDHGNVLSFESPTGYGHIFQSVSKGEGYVVCYNAPSGPVQAFDLGTKENSSSWGTTTVTPGPPVVVTRQTAEGSLSFVQTFTFNATRRALSIQMTLKNISTQALTNVKLRRQVDFDVDRLGSQGWATAAQNVWGSDSRNALFASAPLQDAPPGKDAHTLMLHETKGDATAARITQLTTDDSCTPTMTLGNPSTGDFGGTLIYNVGNLAASASKSFTAEYIRP